MKLDLGVQLSNILLQAQNAFGESAFETFVKSTTITDQVKEGVFSELIKWIILNYSATKSKASPAGTRIY